MRADRPVQPLKCYLNLTAIAAKDEKTLTGAIQQLAELLFFVEGKR